MKPGRPLQIAPNIMRRFCMRRCFIGLMLFMLFILAGTALPVLAQSRALIVIDPGHGGDDVGVQTEQLMEKDLVLRAAFVLAEEFVARGYDVRLTRTGDYTVSIAERRAQAEAASAALFISLHMNRDEDLQKHGIELYANLEDTAVASVAQHMAEALRALDTPVVVEARPWDFLRSPIVPSLMLEVGFLTHPVERRLLVSSSYYRALAAHIVDGAVAALAARK